MNMPAISFGVDHKSNIPYKHKLYSYIEEINSKSENELIIEMYNVKLSRFSKITQGYRIYWNIGNGEYQRLFAMEYLNEQAVECYLVGYLSNLK